MSKKAIRFVILLGVVAIVGIISIQVYFFQLTFSNEERKLNQKIQVALWDVVEEIYELNNIEYVGKNPVYQYSQDYFVVNVNDLINAEILEHYLIKTFEKQSIKLDFEYAIYDCQTDKMVYGKYVNLSSKKNKPSKITLPKYEDFTYYFGIYFPWRKHYLLGNIESIYLLSGILVFVVLFLGYALAFIMRQRRFSELQKDVVNNLTHEFKTPLTSIVLSAEVLEEEGIVKETNRIKKYSKIISLQAGYLLKHIDKVLGTREIEATGKLNKEKVDIYDLLTNALENIIWRVKDKRPDYSIKLESKNCRICADPFHLNNLFINIIDNSLKYCLKEPVIKITSIVHKKKLHLSFADNGIGIERKYQKKIFKKFFRIPSGNIHNVKGFGLGLNYVKNIIKKHHWKYKINSAPNMGTELTLIIPLKDKDCE